MTDPQLPPPPDHEPAAAAGEPVAAEPPAEPAVAEPQPQAPPAADEPEVVDSFAAEPPPEVPVADEPEVVDSFAAEPAPAAPEAPAAPAAPAPAPAAPAPAHRPRGWLPVAALGLAVALAAAATASLGWQVRQQALAESAREQAPAAAREAGRLLFSYSHTTLAADFEKGLAVTTGRFRKEYSRTTAQVVTPVAERYDAVVVADVVEAAVVDASPGEVTVLLFLNQATTSTRVRGQQVDQSRVRMRLVERGGRWLVAEVSAL